MDSSRPGYSVRGILQARTLEWLLGAMFGRYIGRRRSYGRKGRGCKRFLGKEPDFFVRAKRAKKQETSFKAKCVKYGSGVRASGV